MFEMYLDDSGTHGGPYCFLAGYVAATDAWAAFAEEWNEVLREYLRDVPFKTSAAYRESDPGFVPEVGRLKLARCIVEHVTTEVWSVLPDDDSNQVQNEYGFRFDRYRSCFYGVMEAVVCQIQLPLNEQLAWILDHHGGTPRGEQSKLEASLIQEFHDYSAVISEEYRRLLQSIKFADDQVICQLQAADFLAWHKRRRHADGADVPERAAYEILNSPRLKRVQTVLFDHKLRDVLDQWTEPQKEV